MWGRVYGGRSGVCGGGNGVCRLEGEVEVCGRWRECKLFGEGSGVCGGGEIGVS